MCHHSLLHTQHIKDLKWQDRKCHVRAAMNRKQVGVGGSSSGMAHTGNNPPKANLPQGWARISWTPKGQSIPAVCVNPPGSLGYRTPTFFPLLLKSRQEHFCCVVVEHKYYAKCQTYLSLQLIVFSYIQQVIWMISGTDIYEGEAEVSFMPLMKLYPGKRFWYSFRPITGLTHCLCWIIRRTRRIIPKMFIVLLK